MTVWALKYIHITRAAKHTFHISYYGLLISFWPSSFMKNQRPPAVLKKPKSFQLLADQLL